MSIKTAIIPVAGLGTRFLPATKAQPKEMFPVVDKPVIQYIVEEAVASGIEKIIFVISPDKTVIEQHFTRSSKLEQHLEKQGKLREDDTIKHISQLAQFKFVIQETPLGDGHAILAALPFIDQGEPIAVLFGDDIIHGSTPAIGELIETYQTHQAPVIAIQKVPQDEVSRYGIIKGDAVSTDLINITHFVEKPSPKEAPSNLAAVGRYILTPEIYQTLQHTQTGKNNEIRLADAFVDHLKTSGKILGHIFSGKRHDCGNKLKFVIAQIEIGLAHPEIQEELSAYLKQR